MEACGVETLMFRPILSELLGAANEQFDPNRQRVNFCQAIPRSQGALSLKPGGLLDHACAT